MIGWPEVFIPILENYFVIRMPYAELKVFHHIAGDHAPFKGYAIHLPASNGCVKLINVVVRNCIIVVYKTQVRGGAIPNQLVSLFPCCFTAFLFPLIRVVDNDGPDIATRINTLRLQRNLQPVQQMFSVVQGGDQNRKFRFQ